MSVGLRLMSKHCFNQPWRSRKNDKQIPTTLQRSVLFKQLSKLPFGSRISSIQRHMNSVFSAKLSERLRQSVEHWRILLEIDAQRDALFEVI